MMLATETEEILETRLMKQLANNGYEEIVINDEEELIANFRNRLNWFNIDVLDGKDLTDDEFKRFMLQIGDKGVFESSKILRDKQVLVREDGQPVYLQLYNTKDWCKNGFQVTRQIHVQGKYKGRFDVTILVNGLPLMQIELKKRGGDIKEAFNQIKRYTRHNYKGLFKFTQLFVVSNGMDTKYFANSDREPKYEHTFYWSDKDNKRITNLNEFAEDFMEPCHLSKMMARYMILQEAEKVLMVMRPYQVYATEAIIHQALDTNSNGFIWHTTGSGKTLTSFKVSQILSEHPQFDKVFFLVDRQDLDTQTIEEFNKFSAGSVDITGSTKALMDKVSNFSKPLIVTTINKMANSIKRSKKGDAIDAMRDKRVVFIVDECHRTQFGSMHQLIEQHFKNAQFFGFTGTPIMEDNSKDGEMTTAARFGNCLHTYLIKNAIHDRNVLGFNIEYRETANVKPGMKEELVKNINTREVLHDDERLELVVRDIANIHDKKTRDRKYNGLFTVESVPLLIRYYNIFKKIAPDLKVSAVYSWDDNPNLEEGEEHPRDAAERIIQDYNQMYGTSFSTETKKEFQVDLSKRMKGGYPGKVDILLVVDIFLTGFDAKTLNTLYVDRILKYHGLIQAYSRTNRTEGPLKPYGNIVCYRQSNLMKKNTDEAIYLFSDKQKADNVLMDDMDTYIKRAGEKLEELRKKAETPAAVDRLMNEHDQRDFVLAFQEFARVVKSLENFGDFKFTKDISGITEQEFADYRSKYLTIYNESREPSEKKSILNDINFEIDLVHTDRINVAYIMELIRKIDLRDKENLDKRIKEVEKEIDRADSVQLRKKSSLLKSFLNRILPTLSPNDSVDEKYEEFEEQQEKEELRAFAEENKIETDRLHSVVGEYRYSGMFVDDDLDGMTSTLGLIQKIGAKERIRKFVKGVVDKFA